MTASKSWFVFLIASTSASGCGQQLVQFGGMDVAMTVDAAADFTQVDSASAPDATAPLDTSLLADLRLPDLGLPDIRVPDLLIPDQLLPDLLAPDLLPSDLFLLDLGPANPGPLRSLESYAVVAGSTITNTGATTIIGSIGLSPGPMITGIPPGMPIDGSIHVDDGPAAQAQTDLTFAYDFVAAKACGTDLTGMDLGGLTLAPGVYCFNTSAAMAIGSTLILDSQGDPNASWSFQVGSTLILGDFAKIHVINGGRDCSVYWQVGSSATLGVGARLAGSILSQASITLTMGASAGRALARSGGVTMDTNDVAIGPCQ